MLNIPGYQIFNLIYESTNSLVYRGLRNEDKLPIILKFLKEEYPTQEELTRYKQEYEITRNLNIPGVVKAYESIKYHNTPVIILEDFGGESIKNLLVNQKFDLARFLRFAIQITDSLGQIHQHNIIHKDINPFNIVINPQTEQVKIIDFGISSILTRENPTIKNPNCLEGTLPYMSPEQTGRMNRSLDYRTDLYSLGATFYEMITNRLPFEMTDAMEVVYCHIAKQPIPPQQINPEIPQTVSNIIMKLLAKNAEDRYQSAWGIKADLEECLKQLKQQGKVTEFSLGKQDIADKFQIPQKLYGRKREIDTLLTAFERVSEGAIEMMLVSGYSGIGKSALVQEIHKPITKRRGYFITGKFEQFQRNVPYSGVINALKELVGQLLTESESQLEDWRQKISAALGINGRLIIDVIPEIELIIGSQPPLIELGPTESQNRFNLVFQNFIRVFSQLHRPFAIFLDDLQWADSASLKLIELIMADTKTHSLFLIGAYRDNEVDSHHSLTITLENLISQGTTINHINLYPWQIPQIVDLIADTLQSDERAVRDLAILVFHKTEGNPFFINQFITTLYQENLLSFDLISRKWHWNVAEIEAVGITDNVVELMTEKLQKLPKATQQVLRLAACVGNQFDLTTLAIIDEKSNTETFAELLPAIQEGLILANSHLQTTEDNSVNGELVILHYQFLHDRVQQAAYQSIAERDKKATHLKIGKLLLSNIPPEERSEKIFDLVDHLNFGRKLIGKKSEKFELAKLNLEAGKKAKNATAYAAAREYLKVGMEVVGDIWKEGYELAFELSKERAEAEYLSGNFEDAKAIIYQALSKANSVYEQVELYTILILQHCTVGEYQEAVKAGRNAVSLLGVDLPKDDFQTAIDLEFAQVKQNLENREIASLIDAKEMEDPAQRVLLNLLATMLAPLHFYDFNLFNFIIVKILNLSLKYGNAAESPFSYSTYGVMIASMLGDYQSCYQFGLLSLKLSDRLNNLQQKCKNSFLFVECINHWVKHLKEGQRIANEGHQAGLESGELIFAAYLLESKLCHSFYLGKNLEQLFIESKSYFKFARKIKNLYAADLIYSIQINIKLLLEDDPHLFLDYEEVSERDFLERCYAHQSFTAIGFCHLIKSQILYLSGDYNEALRHNLEVKKFMANLFTNYAVSQYNFSNSLILLALYPEVSEEVQKEYWQQLVENQKQMKIWADNCPENFLNIYLLVDAEMARIAGKYLEAIDLYDRAIRSAQENEFIPNQALANELAAKFWLSQGKEKYAKVHMTEAYANYQLWGAKQKLKDLEAKYSHLLTRIARSTPFTATLNAATYTSNGNHASFLDLDTVIKASQAISGEIVLDKLLDKLMKILLENAGAEKGILILNQPNSKMVIEATPEEFLVKKNIDTLDTKYLPLTALNYVERTRADVVLNYASREGKFTEDPYIAQQQVKSLLCTPIVNQGQLIGILYLENNLAVSAFTPERLKILRLLSAQAAISLENALLYASVEQKVAERTHQLNEKNERLEQTLNELQRTQIQLIHSEKMSSLGEMVAGIAHEINNPVNFVYGNVDFAKDYVKNLIKLINLYQNTYPTFTEEIRELTKEIDLEFMLEDLQKAFASMKLGSERIRNIVLGLRNFSRLDEADMKPVDIHEGIDSTLLILQYRLNYQGDESKDNLTNGIEVIKNYGNLPKVICYASQLNQVFMNILTNAIDGIEQSFMTSSLSLQKRKGEIHIYTEITSSDRVKIRIFDNGCGIPEDVKSKIFDPFFTTKPVGRGTGLGLSISYQIVVEKHGGKISCLSTLGEGTEFAIELPIKPNQKAL